MKYLLITVIMALGLFLLFGYSRYLAAREAECQGFLSLLRHIKGRVSGFLTPAAEAARSFSCSALEANGFLPSLREGKGLDGAFAASESVTGLPAGAVELLREYFCRSGRGNLEGELASIDLCIAELETLLKEESGERKNRARVAGALIFALTVGGAILLL